LLLLLLSFIMKVLFFSTFLLSLFGIGFNSLLFFGRTHFTFFAFAFLLHFLELNLRVPKRTKDHCQNANQILHMLSLLIVKITKSISSLFESLMLKEICFLIVKRRMQCAYSEWDLVSEEKPTDCSLKTTFCRAGDSIC
jgi:hypothetical protein